MDSGMQASRRRQAAATAANERFKSEARSWFWASLAFAALAHFLFFALGPPIRAEAPAPAPASTEMTTLNLLPELEIPPPPEALVRPALPAVPERYAELDVSHDITIEPMAFDEVPAAEVPPLPEISDAEELDGYEHFAPYMVAPVLRNREEIRRALYRLYPKALQHRGVGGEVVMWFWIDETGAILRHEIKQSSGQQALDDAALEVVELMRFSPALNRGRAVRVIVALPIMFEVR